MHRPAGSWYLLGGEAYRTISTVCLRYPSKNKEGKRPRASEARTDGYLRTIRVLYHFPTLFVFFAFLKFQKSTLIMIDQ